MYKRIHLIDNGQDLVWVDVDPFATVIKVSPAVAIPIAQMYIGKKLHPGNRDGQNLRLINSHGETETSIWKVERVEVLYPKISPEWTDKERLMAIKIFNDGLMSIRSNAYSIKAYRDSIGWSQAIGFLCTMPGAWLELNRPTILIELESVERYLNPEIA